ncbi:MAG: hypothetical protein JSW11_08735 [Candidatus Heimdallarchaeota archaeon]|nr:MAG: hypothetical protein JSW11_08735 [Candidatus Heimdallarchaeota archaeon]
MSNPQAPWFQMSSDQRREEIIQRRRKNESFAQIAESLLGSSKNKSTIWSWAKRNLTDTDIYPLMVRLPSEPYGTFSDVEQWVMYDIMSSLFPRLDAMSQHLLIEIQKIHTEQKEKFKTTAGFLDDLEERIMGAIGKVSRPVPISISTSTPPPVPRRGISGAPPPPPPPLEPILPIQEGVTPGSMAELRTDFEEMTMEDITALPQDFLEALSPSDRNRVQERVKELRRIDKMTPEEREVYLKKKLEEKERVEAAEGLGGSLTAMLDDSDSLFARMRQAADDSQVSGTGTFGKFTTEYIYFYCFACGKMNRSEEEAIPNCVHCTADPDQLVPDEKKSDYTYWECLSSKNREYIDPSYTRGKQIIVKSRWKVPAGETLSHDICKPENTRNITSAVLVKTDPDKQFSHYLTLFRMYTQLNLQGDLKSYIQDLSDEIQKLPDIPTREGAIHQASAILDKVDFLLDWLDSKGIIESIPDSKEIQIQINNLKQDLKLLQDPDSPQELQKVSEVGQISNKIDQILNRFTSVFLQLESELLSPSRWKCSECENIFEMKDRQNIPELCNACGKIITKLVPVD